MVQRQHVFQLKPNQELIKPLEGKHFSKTHVCVLNFTHKCSSTPIQRILLPHFDWKRFLPSLSKKLESIIVKMKCSKAFSIEQIIITLTQNACDACIITGVGCVATHFEKITHFEKKFQSALNLGPT